MGLSLFRKSAACHFHCISGVRASIRVQFSFLNQKSKDPQTELALGWQHIMCALSPQTADSQMLRPFWGLVSASSTACPSQRPYQVTQVCFSEMPCSFLTALQNSIWAFKELETSGNGHLSGLNLSFQSWILVYSYKLPGYVTLFNVISRSFVNPCLLFSTSNMTE